MPKAWSKYLINCRVSRSEDGVVAQLLIQLQGVFIICAYTAVITYVILKVLNMFIEVRVTNEQEDIGLDMSEHNEQGYSL